MDNETFEKFIGVFRDEGVFNDDYDGRYIWEPIIKKGVRGYLGEKYKDRYRTKAKPRKTFETEKYYDFYIDVENFTGLDFDSDGKLSAREIRRGYFGGSVHDKLIFKSKRYENREKRKAFFLGVYYWLHSFEDSKAYAKKVDESIFSKNQNIRYNLSAIIKPIELKETPKRITPSFINKDTGILIDPEKKRANVQQSEAPVRKRRNNIDVSDNQGLTETLAEPVLKKTPSDFQPPEYYSPQKFDESMWLSPEHPDAIPFIGRDDELKQLDNFADSNGGPFKVWAIAAPSGSGKTRLVMEWMRRSKLKGWRKSILDLTSPEKWETWNPDKPTLIVIDYMFGFDETIKAIIKRCSHTHDNPLNHNVRLLVIDRVPLKSVEKMRGMSEFEGPDLDRIKHVFYSKSPMALKETDNQDEIIAGVIAGVLSKKVTEKAVQKTVERLSEMENAWHPLFAALLARTVYDEKEYEGTNRHDLIKYYLNYTDRLPWKHPGENGKWASSFICAATVLNGVSFPLLEECVPEDKITLSEGFSVIRDICKRIVPIDSNDALAPFEPDMLGQSFFLLFLEALSNYPQLREPFIKMLSVGNEETQSKNALKFLEFIRRSALSLCKDNQKYELTQNHWKALLLFLKLNKEALSANGEMRWAVSAALIEVTFILNRKRLIQRYQEFLIEPSIHDLLSVCSNGILFKPSIKYIREYFELPPRQKFADSDIDFILHGAMISSPWYEEYTEARNILFLLASYFGHTETVDRFLATEEDIHCTKEVGWTALMLACRNGHEAIVERLIEKEAKINEPYKDIENRHRDNVTALMVASRNGHESVVKLLLKEKADVDAADNYGQTALMYASQEGQEAVVKLLIAKTKDIDKGDKHGVTALMHASEKGHKVVATLLIKATKDINATDKAGQTALMYACSDFHEGVVKTLIANGADVNIENKAKDTALLIVCRDYFDQCAWAKGIFSSKNVHERIAKRLIEKGADVNATRKTDGETVLMCASITSSDTLIELLIKKGADINARHQDGWNALMLASLNNNEQAVKILLRKEVNIDERQKNDWTALMLASYHGHKAIVKLLLQKKPDMHLTDKDGKTALSLSHEKEHVEIGKLLVEAGATH